MASIPATGAKASRSGGERSRDRSLVRFFCGLAGGVGPSGWPRGRLIAITSGLGATNVNSVDCATSVKEGGGRGIAVSTASDSESD
jgi:hypothetical protein